MTVAYGVVLAITALLFVAEAPNAADQVQDNRAPVIEKTRIPEIIGKPLYPSQQSLDDAAANGAGRSALTSGERDLPARPNQPDSRLDASGSASSQPTSSEAKGISLQD